MTQKVFYCEYVDPIKNTRQWLLTTDQEFARLTDQSYGLATLDDLLDWAASTGTVFNDIVTVFEGKVKWQEEELLTLSGIKTFYGDYEFL